MKEERGDRGRVGKEMEGRRGKPLIASPNFKV